MGERITMDYHDYISDNLIITGKLDWSFVRPFVSCVDIRHYCY